VSGVWDEGLGVGGAGLWVWWVVWGEGEEGLIIWVGRR